MFYLTKRNKQNASNVLKSLCSKFWNNNKKILKETINDINK